MNSKNSGCRKCRHFRPFRPMSHLLEQELGLYESECVAALTKIMEDERSKRDAEAELRVTLVRDRKMEWPFRPSMSDFCGFEEENDVWLLHQIKNRRRDCENFEPESNGVRVCRNCKYARLPMGPTKDEEALREINRIAEMQVVTGQGGADQEANRYLTLVGTKKAFEAAKTYYSGRFSDAPALYLRTCAHHSFGNTYFPCLTKNPHDACQAFEATNPRRSPPPPPER